MSITKDRTLRGKLLAGAAALAIGVGACGSAASAQEVREYSIASQSLDTALRAFALESGHDVIFPSVLVSGKTTDGIRGRLTNEMALAMLLADSGLEFQQTASGGYAIVRQGEGSGPQDQGAAGGGAEVEALIVTAQKKEEAIQDVPIAISAFTQKSLDAQKIEGGFDLLKAIPNVTFSKSNFSGYNFSIRGIGTKAVSASTDPGVAVSFNSSTLIVNRLFEQEYFDVERVEVLRGPQGTLYGRNATSGVINVISAKPRLGEFEGEVKLEGGNYNAKRVRGMVNVPLGDILAVRIAGAMTQRDGYGTNLAANDPNVINEVREDVDGRDLWSSRITVGWEPIESIRVNAMWERFEEDDNRVRTSKQLCHNDPGPEQIGTFNWAEESVNNPGNGNDGIYPGGAPGLRATTSQGCLPGSLYDDGAFGTPNGASLPYINALIRGVEWGTALGAGGPHYGLGENPFFGMPDAAPCPEAAFWQGVFPVDICNPDPYAGLTQSRDLRTIHSGIEPSYRAKADLFELSIDVDLTDSLTLTSQTVFSRDEYFATQDYNRFTTVPIFQDSLTAACGESLVTDKFGNQAWEKDCSEPERLYADGYYNVTPGGVFTDPQLGPSRSMVAQDLSQSQSEQFNQEIRLASNFDGPVNFSLGSNFTHFETLNDYYVFINALSLLTGFFPFNTHLSSIVTHCPGGYDATRPIPAGEPGNKNCIYVDPNPLSSIDGEGHNYFRSANPYELTSSAVFGELYWQATETLKVTLGARVSWDRKVFTPVPSQLLLHDYREDVPVGSGPELCPVVGVSGAYCKLAGTAIGGKGYPADPDIIQEWREPTGRIIVDWKPDLAFTDETMAYASLAHGYKGGGANPPPIAGPAGIANTLNSGGVHPRTFEPEYIDAFEVGTKNTLLDGALVLNGSAFYYDYKGYQVSKIVDRQAVNENFDATLWGLELEWIFAPTRNLRFNGTVGHLNTKIAEGEQSIDLMDRTQGGNQTFVGADGIARSNWMVVKPWITNASNCIVPVEVVQQVLLLRSGITDLCAGGGVLGSNFSGDPEVGNTNNIGLPGYGFWNPLTMAPNNGAGFFADLGGKELPNAPHYTASLGAQYRMALPGGWDATLRGDFYWQSQSYARAYNTQYDKLRAWTNTNVSLWVENPDWGVTAEVYVKNVFDETPITDSFLNSDDSGLTTNIFTLDPRLVGVSVRKSF